MGPLLRGTASSPFVPSFALISSSQLASSHSPALPLSSRAHAVASRAHGQLVRCWGTSSSATSAAAAVAAPALSPPEVEDLRTQLDASSPIEIIDKALELFGEDAAIAFSGAEDVALIELASLTGRPFRVFCLDTGRLNPETYRFLQKVRERYGVKIEVVFPEAAAVQELVQTKGLFSFYEDGHKECCSIRKVQPLRRTLGGLRAWITGQRRDQSADTRGSVQVVELDGAFAGLDGPGTLIKFNPLAKTPGSSVWSFLDAQGAPLNELHTQGYVSIGCEPCTRPVLPHQAEREGRWWWESAATKECGLHAADSAAATASAPAAASAPAQAPSSPEPLSSSPLSAAASPSPAPAAASNGASPPAPLSREEQPWPDLYVSPHVTDLTRDQLESLLEGDSSAFPGAPSSWLLVVYAPWCPHCQALEPALLKAAEALAGSDGRRTLVAKFRGDRQERPFVGEKLGVKSFPSLFVLRPHHALPPGAASAVGTGRLVKKVSERRDVESLLRWVEALH